MKYLFSYIVALSILGGLALIPNNRLFALDFGPRVPVVDQEHIQISASILELLAALVEKEFKLDPEEEALAKKVLADETEAEIEFIQKGYKGYMANRYLNIEPYNTSIFEKDLSQFFSEVVTSEYNRFMEENLGLNLATNNLNPSSEPGQYLNVVALAVQKTRAGPSPSSEEHRYTFRSAANNNPEAFLAGDFSSGGWSAWRSLTQNPNNNIYGNYLIAQNTIRTRTTQAVGQEQQILDYGQGYHAVQTSEGLVVTPSTLNREKLDRAIATCKNSLEAVDEVSDQLLPTALEQMCQQLTEGLNSNAGLLNVVFDFGDLFNLDFGSIIGSILGGIDFGGILGGFGF